MSTRCRQDLTGCKSRLQSSLNFYREAIHAVEEVWKDETAQHFFQQSLSETEGTIGRMMTRLQEASELVRSFEKKMVDPDLEC
jgi:signal transduction histidine kinase